MNELNGQLKIVQFGIDVENFLGSGIGKYLVLRAEEQRKIALESLAEVDPENAKEVRAIQNQVKVIDAIQQWLADAIHEGNMTAEAVIQAEAQSDQQQS